MDNERAWLIPIGIVLAMTGVALGLAIGGIVNVVKGDDHKAPPARTVEIHHEPTIINRTVPTVHTRSETTIRESGKGECDCTQPVTPTLPDTGGSEASQTKERN